MFKKFLAPLCFTSLCLIGLPLQAAYTISNGKLMNSNEVATMSVQEHYSAAMDAYQQKDWEIVIRHATIVIKNFPGTPFAQDALYLLGVGYFQVREYELANQNLTSYLKKQTTPKYFEEAIQYKFKIAEKFHGGAKKHMLGWESMPKWIPARDEAIAIYDEVITALPHHELAAQALFGKAQLLLKDEEYKSSVETYQTLIRRFPKHPLAVESYIGVGQVYLIQSQDQYPDQDYLDLAEINYRKFRQDFPGEEKLGVAEGMLFEMKEIYASHLYEIGRFYERTGKPHASYIYYTRIIAKYPDTKVSQLANRRLHKLNYKPDGRDLQNDVKEAIQKEPSAPSEQSKPKLRKETKQPSLLELPVTGQIVQTEEERAMQNENPTDKK
ncbi:MAG: outer membrane protein assembly factor BamD [Parachlamydiales bacterium]|nr:outer membrane protein assembly factor BamD [Verrucomicrobiota bacterium]MBX3718505.1 outer membrane protein assembly factor BamD [Candidatus Acheromyda pituitae]